MDQNSVADGADGSTALLNGGALREPERCKVAVGRRLTNGDHRRSYRILSPEELAAGRTTSWHQLEIQGCVRSLSPNLFSMLHLTALFLNHNELQRLPPDISKLTNLRLLDASNNKLLTVPPTLGDLSSLEQLNLNNNLIRILPYELGKLYRLKSLGLLGNPLSPEMKHIYRMPGGTVKLLQYLMCRLRGEHASPPPERQWIRTDRGKEDVEPRFTAMCYNILCDKYATSSQYSYCPSWALSWPYRHKGILQEMTTMSADIMSLQEVETEQFNQLFLPEMRRLGYDAVFSPKSRAKTMAEEERKHVDGCALFWKSDKFALVDQHLIEFTQLAIANAEGCQHMLNRVMTRDNIALVVILQPFDDFGRTGNTPATSLDTLKQMPLITCTAHIHWDPEFCDVKLVQTMMMMQELDRLVEVTASRFGLTDSDDVPVIICGDFNSLPDSGVHEFLSTGRIAADHPDFKDFRNQTCLQRISSLCNRDSVKECTHRLKVESAYESSAMPFTNYTNDFKGVIDYIFATPKTLMRTGYLGPMDIDWFAKHNVVGCPHPSVPSDHMPLMVEYALMPVDIVQQG